MTARHSRPYCGTCHRTMSTDNSAAHAAGATHRRLATRSTSSPGGRASHRPTARAAFRSLRDWDAQYDDDDPGNSAAWDAEYARS